MSWATRSRTGMAAMIESAQDAPLRSALRGAVAVVVVLLLVAHAPERNESAMRIFGIRFTATLLVRDVARLSSPVDSSLLRRVDVYAAAALEEEGLHVAREECASLRIHHVQPVVVDEHRLLLQPVAPARLTDFRHDARANGPRERRTFESGAGLAATGTSHVRHGACQRNSCRSWVRSRSGLTGQMRHEDQLPESNHQADGPASGEGTCASNQAMVREVTSSRSWSTEMTCPLCSTHSSCFSAAPSAA